MDSNKVRFWKAMATIANSPEGKVLLNNLQERREEVRSRLEASPDLVEIHRLQGRADALSTLIDELQDAPEVVRRIT